MPESIGNWDRQSLLMWTSKYGEDTKTKFVIWGGVLMPLDEPETKKYFWHSFGFARLFRTLVIFPSACGQGFNIFLGMTSHKLVLVASQQVTSL